MQQEIPFALTAAAAFSLTSHLIILLQKKKREDPGPSCPSLWGFAVLMEKEATSRGHTIYGDGDPIESCERRPPGTSQRMLTLFFFFQKEKSRHGEKWPLQSWRLLEHSVCPAVQSCDIHCSMQGSFDSVSLLPLRLYFWWLRVLLFFSFCLTEALRIHIEAFEVQKPQIQQGWFGCSLPRVPRWLQSKALQPS